VYAAGVTLLAVLSLFLGAYAARAAMQRHALELCLNAVQRRESDLLEAVRVLTAASRDSTRAVLTALDRILRVLDPSIDAVLVFVPAAEELSCVFAAGPRAEHFEGTRVRRDRDSPLPSRAAMCRHRIELHGAGAILPTDRSALAVPMLAGDALAAVVYAASTQPRIGNADVIVRAVAQAASPYTLASEREADRAQATFDALTGLHTPRAFRTALQEELAAAASSKHATLALWFVDTDHFKRVNDTLGHAAGDSVLQHMARLLQEHTIRGVDLAARNGGDEFCAVIRNVHKVTAIERAQRFCEAVRACNFGVDVPITASIGVAAYPYDASEANELLEMADAAMYHSKRSGRNRVSFALERSSFAVYE
jgi:diguanylate cyclase (GGDEF)-like protein